MKLFQRLLVAPAALGLMAPVAANADTAFSSTTTLGGSAYFTTGSVSAGTGDANEELYMQYAYGLDINSSFSGEDNLLVGIEAGNASGPLADMDSAVNPASGDDDVLKVTSLYYSFPLGDLAITGGPLVDQDDVVAATTSAYSDDFRLGAMPFSLAGNETGPGIGFTYATDGGIVASASFVSPDGNDSAKGINTDTGNDVTTLTLGYNGDGFGGGLVIASNDGDVGTAGYDTFGAGVYYTPESFPATISVAYDTKDPETGSDETDFFIGVDYEVGPGTLSAAWKSSDVDDNSDNTDSSGFEVSYSYAVNDNVTVSPGIFTVEETDGTNDDSGFVVETAFSF
jgi:hypothetical protein